MKKFINENWFKIIISLALVVIATSIVYYIFIFLPQKEVMLLEEQKMQAEAQLQQKVKEFEAKQIVEQQVLREKLEQEKVLAEQQATQAKIEQEKKTAVVKAEQSKQALEDQKTQEKEQNIKDCLRVANSLLSTVGKTRYESMRDYCLVGS